MLAGNKSDVADELRQETYTEGAKLAQEMGNIPFIE